MSDVYAPPPPSPPPPPPPPPAPLLGSGYDFLKPFTFVFDDPRWVSKVVMGGVFVFLAILLIGIPFLFGYIARLTRNVIAGDPTPLPEWDDLGTYFSEGLRLFAVGLVYIVPIVVLAVLIGVPAAIMETVEHDAVRDIGGGLFGCAACLMFPISVAMWFFMPASLLRAVVYQRFGAAFEFGAVWTFISENIGNYLLAIVIMLVARTLAGFGFLLLCIGLLFTEFWSMTVTGYAFAQTYRLAQQK